ncbi:MAG TPA: chromate transporter, partial [Stellaceae bacterium]|nr:chromate transporter [Stellaceae bacterium]
ILILLGTLPFWDDFRKRRGAQAAMRGINAAVVGILAAALYNPLWVSAVKGAPDFALALVAFALLTVWRAPPIVVVALAVGGGIAIGEIAR